MAHIFVFSHMLRFSAYIEHRRRRSFKLEFATDPPNSSPTISIDDLNREMSKDVKRSVALVAIGICIGVLLGAVFFSDSASMAQQSDRLGECVAPPRHESVDVAAVSSASRGHATNVTTAATTVKPTRMISFESALWAPLCSTSLTLEDIKRNYAALRATFSKESLHQTVGHLNAVLAFLRSDANRACWARINAIRALERKALLSSSSAAAAAPTNLFFDCGSRKLDQTSTFVQLYPGARHFSIVCFEPNPKFASYYPRLKPVVNAGDVPAKEPRVYFVNAAVGVAADELQLSDRDVGSSIVNDKAHAAAGAAASPSSQKVAVVPFLDALLFGLPVSNNFYPQSPDAPLRHPAVASHLLRGKVVVKLDVEQAEFAVLHQLVATGAITLIDELLLECHYNTNLPRAQRNPATHIGPDDCYALVNELREASGRTLDVVLWNNKKTAIASNKDYMPRHGGFYPT